MVWRNAKDFGVQVCVSVHRWSNGERCFIKLLKLMFSRLRVLDGKCYRKVYFICSFYLLLHRISKLQVPADRLFRSYHPYLGQDHECDTSKAS